MTCGVSPGPEGADGDADERSGHCPVRRNAGQLAGGRSEGIQCGVQRVGGLNRQGITNAVLGGEGLSLATLEGNGRVILQSLTIESLANALKKVPRGETNRVGPRTLLHERRVRCHTAGR
jgi:hypothetical protein